MIKAAILELIYRTITVIYWDQGYQVWIVMTVCRALCAPKFTMVLSDQPNTARF